MSAKNDITVNVEEIMKEIRRKIAMEEEAREVPTFDSIPIRGEEAKLAKSQENLDWPIFLNSLKYINLNYDIPYYWSFGPNSFKTFCKRVVRKIVKCIILPILSKQNQINAYTVRCINQLRYFAEEIQKRENTDREAINNISGQLNGIESNLKTYERDAKTNAESIAQLEQKFQELTEQYALNRKEQEKSQAQLQWLQAQGVIPESPEKAPQLRQFVSQSGEDMILAYVLGKCGIEESRCTYLDLGANHARELSNTYFFYRRGARGVLVEANPSLIPELKLYRSEDHILNRCISSRSGEHMVFYIMNNDGLSTPDKAQVEEAMSKDPFLRIERTVSVESVTVNELMDTYFDGAPVFMNLDIEGEEMSILESIDFESHRPMLISIEMIPYRTHLVLGKKNSKILDFMAKHDYIEYAFTGINSIFIDRLQIDITGWDLKSIQELLLDPENKINCIPYAKLNEYAEREDEKIQLLPGGITYGPYISLPEGNYNLEATVSLNESNQQLSVTADNGTQILKEYTLLDGENHISFHLNEPQNKVEFVVRNESKTPITLAKMTLRPN